jgi:L-2-hydroxyglutarate oxidase LhgO
MSGVGVVVGAGVVGLACARVMAARGLEVVVLEAAHMIGTGVSSRNSEVIHAGIYYPKGSLKARACVEGRQMLYDYCRERAIGHERCGKLIVATSADQLADLERIKELAAGNGVHDLRVVSAEEACGMEPSLSCVGALVSPSTGIVDSHSLMLSLQGDAEARGACVVFNTPVLSYEVLQGRVRPSSAGGGGHIRVRTGGAQPMEMDCDVLVNAAGLFAPDLARQSGDVAAPTP